MDIDVRKHIFSNFKDNTIDQIRNSIEDAIKKGDEITLPGLGVFFEVLWNKTSEEEKECLLNHLQEGFK